MKKRYFFIFLLVISLVLVDQATKYVFYDLWFVSHFTLIEPILNTGISYGISVNYFFVLGVSILVFFLMLRWVHKGHISYIVASLFLAWLLGNLLDRLYLNWVRDFFVFFDWFIFNIADLYLTISLILLAWEEKEYVQKMSWIFSWKKIR